MRFTLVAIIAAAVASASATALFERQVCAAPCVTLDIPILGSTAVIPCAAGTTCGCTVGASTSLPLGLGTLGVTAGVSRFVYVGPGT